MTRLVATLHYYHAPLLSMLFTAYRPEYHLGYREELNQVVFQRFEEFTLADALPHYLADWQRALTLVRPGFTVLCDLRRTLGPNTKLLPIFQRARELMHAAGLAMMAEVHPRSATMMQMSRVLHERAALPVQRFTDLQQAEEFLACYAPNNKPAGCVRE